MFNAPRRARPPIPTRCPRPRWRHPRSAGKTNPAPCGVASSPLHPPSPPPSCVGIKGNKKKKPTKTKTPAPAPGGSFGGARRVGLGRAGRWDTDLGRDCCGGINLEMTGGWKCCCVIEAEGGERLVPGITCAGVGSPPGQRSHAPRLPKNHPNCPPAVPRCEISKLSLCSSLRVGWR